MGDTRRAYSWRTIPHLAQRTLWSLRRPEPDAEGERWLLSLCSPAEARLYRSMAAVDRAHAVNSARAVASLGDEVVVASALHDVGKSQAGLGTPGRVAASLAALVIHDRARNWRRSNGFRGQIGRYLDHSEIGAAELQAAGVSDLAVTWAREHHLAPSERSIDPALAAALAAADR